MSPWTSSPDAPTVAFLYVAALVRCPLITRFAMPSLRSFHDMNIQQNLKQSTLFVRGLSVCERQLADFIPN